MDHPARLHRLLFELERRKIDALLVTHLPNVRYLCGFTGSAGILLAGRRSAFFTDGRYSEQSRSEVQGARVVIGKGPTLAVAARHIGRSRVVRLGIEADHLTVALRSQLATELGKGIKLVPVSGAVETLRMIKEPAEIEAIREAVNLAARLLAPLLRGIRPGVPETTVAARLEYMARRAGAEGMSFETIVASGPRSALPHGVASTSPIARNGFVVLDYGVILNGYCSDMTRTVYAGKPGEEERALYRAVLEAQLAAITAVTPGLPAGEVDEAARSVLKRARLAKFFTHSTGHGVGLEVHEMPRLAFRQEQVLQPGMVVTVEPGVYLPGRCGIRIEDMVLVTERGFEVLTPATKDLIEL